LRQGPKRLPVELAEQAGVRLHQRPGADLINAEDAHAFLDACLDRGVRVLGAEGFQLRGEDLYVDMDRILDLSLVTGAADSVAEAKRFVDEVATPGLMLDFTLDRA
jgi:hypothetical protein